MISVAVVEDEAGEADLLKTYLTRYGREAHEVFTVEHFPNAVVFLEHYTPKYDLVFFDIGLPHMDGMQAAARLRALDAQVTLIFVTNMAQFAVKGYEVDAFDFIVKPVVYDNFALKLHRALGKINAAKTRYILIASDAGKLRVDLGKLSYVEITGHKLVYHTQDGQIVSYGTLKQAEELIDDPLFFRCNSCYLVNLRQVTALKGMCVRVGGDELLVSQPRRAPFEKALADYLGGGGGGGEGGRF
jgi:DNA-binding LytR/AlgR family response regulator